MSGQSNDNDESGGISFVLVPSTLMATCVFCGRTQRVQVESYGDTIKLTEQHCSHWRKVERVENLPFARFEK